MRVDKWLKVSRIIKRRGTAKDLCLDGDILLNDKKAKPMSEIKVGDTLVLILGKHKITAKVLQIREFAKKEDAEKMYQIVEDSLFEEEKSDARL